ncbi:hypothetical protein [Okeania sp. SIO2G5]|uniref:hypothetical protein n=1 Tax=Okeania sp. SIO2G5 TaxID=2607796 RepID=UPI0013BF8BCC|nr:hypothetical protein [Okeania sp. SIO2G5]NEP76338.1 hypothetical protein [Okeania sp. SIO2G5]
MFIASVLTATDTAFNALDWTRDALTTLGYWQNANSRRLIRFLESDRFHQFIRHTARAWVIFCIMVRFVIAMLTPVTPAIATASDEVVAEMTMQRPVILSTFTADCWPDDADNDLALLNGWEV